LATALCAQVPAPLHTSAVQALPSLAHATLAATLDQWVVLDAGVHTWQEFDGFFAPLPWYAPLM
jgi:hypothetical protein